MASREERKGMRALLLRAVIEYRVSRNAERILDPRLLSVARQLLAAVPAGQPLSVEARGIREATGWLYLCRQYALPEGAGAADLTEALAAFEPLYAEAPATVPEAIHPYLRWTALVRTLTSLEGRPGTERETIRLAREALSTAPPGATGLARIHNDLGVALTTQAERSYHGGLIDDAVAAFQEAATWSADRPADQAGALCNIIRVRTVEFRAGADGHLDEVAEVAERVLALPTDHDVLAFLLDEVCRPLWVRSGEGADPALLPQLARLCGLAAEAASTDVAKGGHLARRALALARLGRHTGDPATLAEALRVARQSQVLAGADHDGVVLAEVLQAVAERKGGRELFAEAVEIWRAVAGAVPAGDPRRGGLLNSLGVALRGLVEYGGDPALLPECVQAHAEAVAATAPDDVNLGGRTVMYGVALWRWSDYTGDSGAGRGAIAVLRRGVDLTPLDHPERWTYLSNLAIARRHLARRLDDPALLDAAVSAHREALAAVPAHPTVLTNLAAALHDRYEDTGNPADLDEAIDCWERVLDLRATDDAGHLLAAGGLGAALRERFEGGNDPADLRRAVDLAQQAVDATPRDDPRLLGRLAGLSNTLATWAANGGGPDAISRSRAALEAASKVRTGPVSKRVRYATLWGAYLTETGRVAEAATVLAAAVRLLPDLLPAQLSRRDAEHELSYLSGLGPAAAACALELGQPDRALELAEQSRGVLLALALRVREELSRLERAAPELAARLRALSVQEPAESSPEQQPGWLAVRERDELLGGIRALPGFEGFLRPAPAPDPGSLALAGPVVLVNTSPLRSDAIAVTTRGLTTVPLPDLSPAAATRHGAVLDAALAAAHDPRRAGADRAAAEDRIGAVLAWLWDAVCGPVLDALDLTTVPAGGQPWPRLWWVPTGPLTLLPLHAAGYHRGGGPAVLDRVVSSYAPTMRALASARARAGRAVPARRAVAVAMAHTPGQPDLPAAGAEVAAVTTLLPGSTRLVDGQATRERVLAELRRHPWAHLSCHAAVDTGDSSASYLALHDGPLRVADLTRQWLPAAELAYLSACATQRGGPELADEAVHLGGAFFLAGYTHVIATYWPIQDGPAGHVARDIYRQLGTSQGGLGDTPATAVHTAVRALRDSYPERPSLWAPFVHTGP